MTLENENRIMFSNAIGKQNTKKEKRTTKMEVQIPFSNVVGKQKTKNGNGNLNFVFQSRKKTKNEINNFPIYPESLVAVNILL